MFKHTVNNILEFNRLLHECCTFDRLFYLNVFREFLDKYGFKNSYLFEKRSPVHPNQHGMGRLARHYINIIHDRRFNPLAY